MTLIRVNAKSVQQVLLTSGLLPPLSDEDGEPYEAASMPCTVTPSWWDSDASVHEQREARRECTTCPAIVACAARRRELGLLASGVWAAKYYGPKSDEAERSLIYDATVQAWVTASGVTVKGGPRAS